MSLIRILPDRVANQIAAGEVIERPVAVIKELVENSIDAGASRIEIEFRNGGKAYMRVEDNGKGMDPDEALLCLERHATSKIRDSDDLDEVQTFGFRGEALPSIASVARFTLRTRKEGYEHGTEVNINGGKLINKKACGMPVGTMIEVSQLFNAVPARRKFLKTDATETAHITYTCRLFAIANPQVAFRVLENGRQVFQSPACRNLRERIGEIWGRSLARDLIPVEAEDKALGYRLTGLTAKPGIGRSTRRELVTLVNRRPVDSRTLGFAVLDAYHGRLQKGRYPPAFLFLEIAPREIDVNVHPAKREVRFRKEGEIRRFVLGAVSKTLANYHEEFSPGSSLSNQPGQAAKETSGSPKPKPSIRPAKSKPTISVPESTDFQTARTTPRPSVETTPPPKPVPESPPTTARQSDWKLLSLLKERYALFESPRGLVLLHLRQADQRVRFEQIMRSLENVDARSQGLLIPEPFELEPLAAEALEAHRPLLNSQGFSIEPFGRHFYRIEAVPTWLPSDQAESYLRDLIDEIRQRGGGQKNNKLVWETVANLAVRGSYQKSDRMSSEEACKLVDQLLDCAVPHTSPFGKPTYHEISWNDLERRFGAS